MRRDTKTRLPELRVDGGATRNDSLMQFQADILGIPVVRSKIAETTALGAAYLAGLATGVWQDISDIAKNWALDAEFVPRMDAHERDQRYGHWQEAVRRVLK